MYPIELTVRHPFQTVCKLQREAESLIHPAEDSVIVESTPFIQALVYDAGVGIDMSSLEVSIDGTPTTPLYSVSYGNIRAVPAQDLASGPHVLTIVARDTDRNTQNLSMRFTVRLGTAIYLPLLRR